MNTMKNLIDALEFVTDRLALHVEYEKYADFRENVIDKRILGVAESMLTNAIHPTIGVRMLAVMGVTELELRHVLSETAERLRLHIVNHSYDDDTENDSDSAALGDANSLLHTL